MRRKFFFVGAFATAVTLLAACQDQPLGPSSPVIEPARLAQTSDQSTGGLHAGEVPFVCVLSRPKADGKFGWESRRQTIYFPRPEVARDGRTIPYAYVVANSAGWERAAYCVIPQTEAAVRRMDRFFRTDRTNVQRSEYGGNSGGISAMGCVDDGACTIEGITVTAPPSEEIDYNFDCTMGCDNGWWNGGGSYTGNTEFGGWVGGGDADGDGDYADEGPITFAVCVAARLGVGGWGAIGGTALAAFELWGTYSEVRAAKAKMDAYDAGFPSDPNWNNTTSDLYEQQYNDKVSAQESLWRALGLGAGIASAEFARAVGQCIPAAAAPTG